jgi:methionyl-tRNA formyltransferase
MAAARLLLRRQAQLPLPWPPSSWRRCSTGVLLRATPLRSAALPGVVFLGTPDCACCVLDALLDASEAADAPFRLSAVVSQPGKPRGRGRGSGGAPPPSPVAARALERGLSSEQVLTPANARCPVFLAALEALQPALCVTAAYGHFLPASFLDTPAHGTLNVHPSLLPRWRGAAPVQRALEAGDTRTGVTLAYTVLAMARALRAAVRAPCPRLA